jgi:hypothetical protein
MIARFLKASLAAAGLFIAALGSPARAGCDGCGSSAPAASASCGSPCTRTITVTEWVPENYETTRTSYKTEQVQEKYTAYRTECVPETRTRTVCCNKMVTECKTGCRTVYKCVPTCETRTIYKKVCSYRQVTCNVRKCVDNGHYECQEVPCGHGLFGGLFKGHKHCGSGCGDCCDPCASCCQPTKLKKVWVPCKTYIDCPVTKCEKFTECVPETITCTVNKMVATQETYTYNVCRCVPETRCETYTVNVQRCVPYEACRTVCKCVPVCEKVTCCRMVPRCVTKEVPACECSSCCETTCCSGGHSSFFGGCRKFFGGCHNKGCCGCN